MLRSRKLGRSKDRVRDKDRGRDRGWDRDRGRDRGVVILGLALEGAKVIESRRLCEAF